MKTVITFIAFIGIGILFLLFSQYSSTLQGFESDERVAFSIEYGQSVAQTIDKLYEKEIIQKKWPVSLYIRWYKKGKDIQAGDFILTRGTEVPKLIEQLSNAKSEEIPFRIIEGSTLEEIDALLAEKGLTEEGEFLKCAEKCDFSDYSFIDESLEGYIFPDTYFVPTTNFDVRTFIYRTLNNFETRLNSVIPANARIDLHDIVIMASIIEKEERDTANMPIISGILWKRIAEGIPMGADATTRYYEKNPTGFLSSAVFQKDNPYNTRRKLGLPPTAIGSPGLKALQAAINPEDSPYYYYLHDSFGNIHYARTNDEHNINKAKYIQ